MPVEPAAVQRGLQGLGGPGPHGLVADGHPRLRGQPDGRVGEAEGRVDLQDQVEDPEDLLDQLVFPADDVGVVLGPAANPQQPVQGPHSLVPVDGAQLEQAHGKVAIGPRL